MQVILDCDVYVPRVLNTFIQLLRDTDTLHIIEEECAMEHLKEIIDLEECIAEVIFVNRSSMHNRDMFLSTYLGSIMTLGEEHVIYRKGAKYIWGLVDFWSRLGYSIRVLDKLPMSLKRKHKGV